MEIKTSGGTKLNLAKTAINEGETVIGKTAGTFSKSQNVYAGASSQMSDEEGNVTEEDVENAIQNSLSTQEMASFNRLPPWVTRNLKRKVRHELERRYQIEQLKKEDDSFDVKRKASQKEEASNMAQNRSYSSRNAQNNMRYYNATKSYSREYQGKSMAYKSNVDTASSSGIKTEGSVVKTVPNIEQDGSNNARTLPNIAQDSSSTSHAVSRYAKSAVNSTQTVSGVVRDSQYTKQTTSQSTKPVSNTNQTAYKNAQSASSAGRTESGTTRAVSQSAQATSKTTQMAAKAARQTAEVTKKTVETSTKAAGTATKAGASAGAGVATGGISLAVQGAVEATKAYVKLSVSMSNKLQTSVKDNRNDSMTETGFMEKPKDNKGFLSGLTKNQGDDSDDKSGGGGGCLMLLLIPAAILIIMIAAVSSFFSGIGSSITSLFSGETEYENCSNLTEAAYNEFIDDSVVSYRYSTWYTQVRGGDTTGGVNQDAAFVSYCADICGFIDEGTAPSTANTIEMYTWYTLHDAYRNASESEIKTGDIVFISDTAGNLRTGIAYQVLDLEDSFDTGTLETAFNVNSSLTAPVNANGINLLTTSSALSTASDSDTLESILGEVSGKIIIVFEYGGETTSGNEYIGINMYQLDADVTSDFIESFTNEDLVVGYANPEDVTPDVETETEDSVEGIETVSIR